MAGLPLHERVMVSPGSIASQYSGRPARVPHILFWESPRKGVTHVLRTALARVSIWLAMAWALQHVPRFR